MSTLDDLLRGVTSTTLTGLRNWAESVNAHVPGLDPALLKALKAIHDSCERETWLYVYSGEWQYEIGRKAINGVDPDGHMLDLHGKWLNPASTQQPKYPNSDYTAAWRAAALG